MTPDKNKPATVAVPRPADRPISESRAAANDTTALERGMRKKIVRMSWGLLITGGISLVLSGFLDPIWGGMLMVGGVVGLFLHHRAAFLALGIILLVAGLANILSFNTGWIIFGILQLGWATREFQRYRSYADVGTAGGGDVIDSTDQARGNAHLGIASLVLFALALVAGIVAIAIGAAHVVNPEGTPQMAETQPATGVVLFMTCPLLALVGAGLGIAGIVGGGRARRQAIIGLCLNALIAAAVILLIVAGS